MIIGIPKEIKAFENRVGATPAGVSELVKHGHTVWVEQAAGQGSGFADAEYAEAGAQIVASVEKVWSANMVMKVKEPLLAEYGYFREDLLLFTYLHLAAEAELTAALLQHKTTAVAYETVQLANRRLPLLQPMSEVAGRMSVQVGAQYLTNTYGGKGILLGGVPGVSPGKVVIIGGGISGTQAAKMAVGLGARVVILDINSERLRQLDDLFGGRVQTVMSNRYHIAREVRDADLLIGAVLIPGARAPRLVTKKMVESMGAGSVIVDIAIDQGGCIETIDRVTYHNDPVYKKYGVLHYAVGNMPGASARTSTLALTNATTPYAIQLANKGFAAAAQQHPPLAHGANTYAGHVVHQAVATSLGYQMTPLQDLITSR
ncbi:MAG: alanine dehydrogenase [Ardenticatenaceae bacterium]